MGAGRRTQTLTINERISSSTTKVNSSVSARNLRKSDLRGVIFGCTHKTMAECLTKQLFGLPAGHSSYVRNIQPGLPLFLFNYNDRKLHGIFESTSSGQLNIDPYGWSEDGMERTPYPAQVRICVQIQCQPLSEMQFRPIICDNFYSRGHFWFELDSSQVDRLRSLFLATSNGGTRVNLLNSLPNAWKLSPITKMKTSASFEKEAKSSVELVPPNHFGPLFWDDVHDNESGSSTTSLSSAHEDINLPVFKSAFPDLDLGNMDIGCSSFNPYFDGDGQTLEVHSEEVKDNNSNMVSSKLEQLVSNHECLNPFESERSIPYAIGSVHKDDGQPGSPISSVKDGLISAASSNPHHELAQLKQDIQGLKSFRMEQLRQNIALQEKLIAFEVELRELRSRVDQHVP